MFPGGHGGKGVLRERKQLLARGDQSASDEQSAIRAEVREAYLIANHLEKNQGSTILRGTIGRAEGTGVPWLRAGWSGLVGDGDNVVIDRIAKRFLVGEQHAKVRTPSPTSGLAGMPACESAGSSPCHRLAPA